MKAETCRALIALNRAFYAQFAGDFAATRRGWPLGFTRILPYLSTAANVLDVGCGNGRFLAFLRAAGWGGDYVGVDSSAGLLAEAEALALPDAQFVLADLLGPDWGERALAELAALGQMRQSGVPDSSATAAEHPERRAGILSEHRSAQSKDAARSRRSGAVFRPRPHPLRLRSGHTSADHYSLSMLTRRPAQDAGALLEQGRPPPQVSAADAVVCLAVLHHIPGRANRVRFLAQCGRLLAANGCLILSTWQFMASPRLRGRVLPWAAAGLREEDVEPGDHLVAWGQGAAGQRYCAFIPETELVALATEAGLAPRALFDADGHEGNLNLYGVFSAR